MPYAPRPVDRSCKSYFPGHQVHWIQAKKSMEDQPVIEVSIVVHHDGRVDVEGDELKLALWNHDPDRLRSALDYWGRAAWKPRYHVLTLPGSSAMRSIWQRCTNEHRANRICIRPLRPPKQRPP